MTLETAQTHLNSWLSANLALATMQSYSITTPSGQQVVTRTDADKVQKEINYWQDQVTCLSGRKGSQFSTAEF